MSRKSKIDISTPGNDNPDLKINRSAMRINNTPKIDLLDNSGIEQINENMFIPITK